MVIFVSRDIGLPAGWLGTVFVLAAAESIAGASRAPRLGRRIGLRRPMACFLAVLLMTMQQIAGDAGHTLHDRTLRQTAMPAALLARADAAVRSAGQLATLASK